MEALRACVKSRHYSIFERALEKSTDLTRKAEEAIGNFVAEKGETLDNMCFAVVGSTGRKEALEASDLDLIPIAANADRLAQYEPHDSDLRQALSEKVGVKVSRGEDLTKATSIEALVEVDSIGGGADTSARLTKRILLLTESSQAGGSLPIRQVREALLDAYAKQERTSGRHVLALCNDISRYYKTLCIEYKAKIDDQDKDWCTRNIKLRHSRKLWYFANILAVATLADKHPQGEQAFKDSLLDSFESSPIQRLAAALSEQQPLALGRLLESYALFLEFMSAEENREALRAVQHERRYEMSLANPFPMMKFSSDLLHNEIMSIMEEMGPAMRARIMGWFLL
jgi:hypothetical protein